MESKVELYYDYRFCNITLSMSGIENWNLPMNENRFKLFKNSNTVIQFILRNNDRKPLNLSGMCFFITINDEKNNSVLMHKSLQVVDEKQGQVKLVTTPEEVRNWPIGALSFNISINEGDGNRLLYLDQMETARGFLILEEGPYIGPKPSQYCDTFTPVMIDDLPSKYRVWSSVMKGTAQNGTTDSTQTVAIKLCNYSGRITIYCSLEKAIPLTSDDTWFPIQIGKNGEYYDDLINFSGNIHYDFSAMNYWTVVAFDPLPAVGVSSSASPYDVPPPPLERIRELWYRN